jgi:D-3-phosphoglycerate dehydrogenase / 2-oxoglutarate reductase
MSQNKCVLVNADIRHLPESRALLEKHFKTTYMPEFSRPKLLKIIPDYDAVLTNIQTKYNKEFIDAAKNLTLIATPSTGTDHIDLNYAKTKGITVQSIKNDYDLLRDIPSTAEQAFLLMMASLRKLPAALNSVCSGNWARDEFRGREVNQRIVGIIGYGRLGEIFSRFAHAFNMKVIACDPYKKITDPWVTQMDMKELLKTAEIISLHLHLNDETRGMLGEKEFSLMRDGVFIVNTSRGAIIDENAFLKALESGKIEGAGIDVLSEELDVDISDIELVKYAKTHDNLIITPHVGGCTYDAQEKTSYFTIEKMIDFFALDNA